MLKLSKAYQRVLRKHLIFTQALQTGILLAGGDLIAQKFIENDEYNPHRTAQFATLGFCLVGPAVATWYRILAWGFGSGSMKIALKKLACDQLLFAPGFTPIFLAALSFLQGRDVDDTIAHVKRDYVDIMVSNYKVWPAVIVTNFYLTPLRYQVLVMQSVGVCWNTYISWKTQHK